MGTCSLGLWDESWKEDRDLCVGKRALALASHSFSEAFVGVILPQLCPLQKPGVGRAGLRTKGAISGTALTTNKRQPTEALL